MSFTSSSVSVWKQVFAEEETTSSMQFTTNHMWIFHRNFSLIHYFEWFIQISCDNIVIIAPLICKNMENEYFSLLLV